MPRSFEPLLIAALASACATDAVPRPRAPGAGQPPPPLQAPPAPAARIPSSLGEIGGEWDIVEFDGHRPPRLDRDGLRHAYVDIAASGMRFTIGCNYSGMAGSIGAGGVLLPSDRGTSMQTQMGCGAEREARDSAFFDFFRSRPQVALLPDGRLRMKGAGSSLLLERADIRRRAYGPPLAEITGTWRVVSFTRFINGGHHGWGPMFAPGRVRIDGSTIRYSRCPGLTVGFRYTADFTLLRQTPARMPGGACSGIGPAATEVEPMIAVLLGQSPHAERVPGGRWVLRSRDYALLLASEADYRREFGDQAVDWERRPG